MLDLNPSSWATGWLLRSSLQAAVLVLLVLAVQWLGRRWLPPRWRHALWWLVVARLLVPAFPESAFSLFNWAPWRAATPGAVATKAPANYPAPVRFDRPEPQPGVSAGFNPIPAAPAELRDSPPVAEPATAFAPPLATTEAAVTRLAPTVPRRDWPALLTWLWLAGVVGLVVHVGFSALALHRRLRRATPVNDLSAHALLDQMRERMGVRRQVALLETTAVTSPALCGLIRPRLLLPPGLVGRFTAAELRFVFLHELAHLKRHDIAVNWLTTLLQVVHWFNPLLWLAFHRMRADGELACDAAALRVAAAGEHHAYGQTIIKLLESAARPAMLPGVVGILEDRGQIRQRIRMIARFHPTRRGAWAAGFGVVLLGAVCLTDAQSSKPTGSGTPVAAATNAATAGPVAPAQEVCVGADPVPELPVAGAEARALILTVLDAATSKPLSGAEVLAPYIGTFNQPQRRRLTDDQGRYTLRFVIPPVAARRQINSFNVSARHPDFAQRAVMWTSSAGDVHAGLPADVTLRLERGVTIGGRVEDGHGAAVAGVGILLSGSGYSGFSMGADERRTHEYAEVTESDPASPAAVTDPSGRWTYTRVPADLERLELTLARPDGPRSTFSTAAAEHSITQFPLIPLADLRATNAVLVLPEGLTVRGIVVDEAGQPLAGATVREGYGHGNIVRASEFTTGADGRFERPHRVPRQWIHTATRADRATVSVVAQVESGMGEVRLVLPPAQPLRLSVVDEAGAPLPGVQFRVDPYRTEAQIHDWTATTDADGIAVWTNAPTAAVMVPANSKSPAVTRKFRTVPGESGRRLVLSAAGAERVTIRLRAVDARTREGVKLRRVAADYVGGGSAPKTVAEPDAAECRVTLPRSDIPVGMYPSYRLQIAADGYETHTTRFLDFDEGDQELELALTRSDGTGVWVIRQPDGQPAAGARIWVRTSDNGLGLHINAPGQYYGDQMAKADADAEGRVKPAPAPRDAPVVITHPSGILEGTARELQARSELRLQPYGAVEGRVLVGGQPKGGVNVSLNPLSWSPSLRFYLSYTANTAPDGTFRFLQVPAGDYKLYRWSMPARGTTGGRAITETCQWPLMVKAGETNRVEYAITGRVLTGQAVADPAEVAVDWQHDDHVLALKLPAAAAPRPVNREDYATFEAFKQASDAAFRSDRKVEQARRARTYQLEFEPDGAFRVEDVPPGTYTLRLRVTKEPEPGRSNPFPGPQDEIGSLTREIVVPEGTGPLDLETLVLPVKAGRGTRKSAPFDLTAMTFDGQSVRLAEVPGRARLVVFWAAWSERSLEALADLRRLREELGPDSGLTLVGVNLDDDPGPAARLVQEGGYDWLQTHLGTAERGMAAERFEVSLLPTILLLDAEGRVTNRDLAGERLRLAVRRVLKR